MNETFFSNLDPLEPIPTEASYQNHLTASQIAGLRGIIFDIYGTLLVSDSGDIGSLKNEPGNIVKAFEKSGVQFRSPREEAGRLGAALFKTIIGREHKRKTREGADHPEVDIVEVWRQVIEEMADKNHIQLDHSMDVETVALHFEMLSNAVYPMPRMREVLESLHRKGLALGIVSNAQFFTPMILKYFMGARSFQAESPIPLFDPRYCIFSYQHGLAKPSIQLFQRLVDVLRKNGELPEKLLFVGNDMLNDVYAASVVGFKTALYAGDKRSLRTRETHEAVRNTRPDLVVTRLGEILDLFGHRGE